METQGMLHLYMGNGKGKTTAAVGLCVRACGQGLRVIFAQFLKSGMSGERVSLSAFKNISLIPVPNTIKFTWDMDPEELKAYAHQARLIFKDACAKAADADLIVLDELTDAIVAGLLDEAEVLSFIAQKPDNLEVVITGRSASPLLIKKADYVTNMICEKHPYEKGVAARRGVEY